MIYKNHWYQIHTNLTHQSCPSLWLYNQVNDHCYVLACQYVVQNQKFQEYPQTVCMQNHFYPKKYIKVFKNYNLSTSTREFLQIFRKLFIKVPVLSPFILEGACGILQWDVRDPEQIVRTASINSNEVIRGLTWIRLKVTLIALLTNRPTPPPLRPDVRVEWWRVYPWATHWSITCLFLLSTLDNHVSVNATMSNWYSLIWSKTKSNFPLIDWQLITPNLTPGIYFLTVTLWSKNCFTLEFPLFTCLYPGLQILRLNKRFLISLRNWDVGCTLKERKSCPEHDKVVQGNPLHITVESSQIIWNIQYTSVSKYTCVFSIPGGAIIWSDKCELLPCMKENNGSWWTINEQTRQNYLISIWIT